MKVKLFVTYACTNSACRAAEPQYKHKGQRSTVKCRLCGKYMRRIHVSSAAGATLTGDT